jgi:hypothetical protein
VVSRKFFFSFTASVLLILLGLLSSCATKVPVRPLSFEEQSGELIGMLPQGARLYLYMDAKRAQPILRDLVDALFPDAGSGAKTFLEKTDACVLGLYNKADGGRTFCAAARGSYPTGRAGMALGMSSAWEKDKKGIMLPDGKAKLWRDNKSGGELALSRTEFLASDGPLALPAAGQKPQIPGEFYALGGQPMAAAAGWAPNAASPSSPLNALLSWLGLPVRFPAQKLLFAVMRTDDGFEADGGDTNAGALYSLTLKAEMADGKTGEQQAAALARLWETARRLAARMAPTDKSSAVSVFTRLLTATPCRQEGNYLVLETASMDGETLTLLLAGLLAAGA